MAFYSGGVITGSSVTSEGGGAAALPALLILLQGLLRVVVTAQRLVRARQLVVHVAVLIGDNRRFEFRHSLR